MTEVDPKIISALLSTLKEEDKATTEDEVWQQKPITAKEFLNSQYHLGPMVSSIWDIWRQELEYVLDPDNDIKVWMIHGALGIGKSTAAMLAQLYSLYRLVCMKNPQETYGLAPGFPLFMAFFNVTKGKAEESLALRFSHLINMSPFFRHNMTKNPRKIFLPHGAAAFGPGYREHPTRDDLFEVILPHNIRLLFGSKTQHALSLDIFSALLDEMNFRKKKSVRASDDEDAASNLWAQIYRRITSRFVEHPGLLIAISSARSSNDFIEEQIRKIRQGDIDHAHVSAFSHWKARPDRYPSGQTFRVFVGGKYRKSKILLPDETIKLESDEKIIDVPEELRRDFEQDLSMSLRDLAGIATAPTGRLISDPKIVWEAVEEMRESPVPSTIMCGFSEGEKLERYFDLDMISRFNGVERRLKYHPGVARFVHVDLSKSLDRSGIACGCIPEFSEYKEKHPVSGHEIIHRLPIFFLDFAFGLTPIPGDEIDYEAIRKFILWLTRATGYQIRKVTFDSYQSTHAMQLLRASRVEAEEFSVDRTDKPYSDIAVAFREHRVQMPENEILITEFIELIHDISGRVGKVDHPRDGSKDISDAVTAVYSNCLMYMDELGWSAPNVRKIVPKTLNDGLTPPTKSRSKRLQRDLGLKQPLTLDVDVEKKLKW